MRHDQPSESDWKRFRKIVPELRERYLRERNSEIAALLRDESSTPTNQFWTACGRIQETGKILRSCLDGHSRSTMMNYLMLMYRHQMLRDEDMKGFSDEVVGRLDRLAGVEKGLAQQAGESDNDKPPG